MSQHRKVRTENMVAIGLRFFFYVNENIKEKDGFLFFSMSGIVLSQSSKSL